MSIDQNLPLGPVDRRQAARRHWLRRHRRQRPRFDATVLLGGLGLLLALVGVWLSRVPPRVEVRATQRSYAVGGVALAARGGGVYQGPAGVVVLRDRGQVLDGAASSTVGDAPMTGHCSGAVASGERCTFRIGSRTLRAVDTWEGGAWSRVYGDGVRVQLVIADGRPVPVPIPVDASP